TYVYVVQKAIGQMTAALGGIDMLVFTGTVGERSSEIRQRILKPFHYLDLSLDSSKNEACVGASHAEIINKPAQSKPVFVVPARENAYMAMRAISVV
ncbi:hypothetical protein B7Z28_00545, partial [Candidatus Saccharibacteria bacterium 32-45-3]